MGKWLSKFSGETLEDRTDKADILAPEGSVSGMSVPLSDILPKISTPPPHGGLPSPDLQAVPDRYCPRCGGGYWIRETSESAYQCGRCTPAEPHVESVYVPGGTTPPPEPPASRIRAVADLKIEPAASDAKAIYWQASTGRILGPAVPEFLARDGSTFWISTTFNGQILWIDADRLRSRKAFERQPKILEVAPIL